MLKSANLAAVHTAAEVECTPLVVGLHPGAAAAARLDLAPLKESKNPTVY